MTSCHLHKFHYLTEYDFISQDINQYYFYCQATAVRCLIYFGVNYIEESAISIEPGRFLLEELF